MLSATKKLPVAVSGYVRVDEGGGQIVNPHALPMYRDTGDTQKLTKRKYEKIRKDPVATKKPERPMTGPGFGGKTGGSTFTQFFMRDYVKAHDVRSEDPREAILKYAEAAEKDPLFMGHAYAATQPRGQLDPRYTLAKQTFEEEKMSKEEEDRRLLDC
jgi:hypothetical protein